MVEKVDKCTQTRPPTQFWIDISPVYEIRTDAGTTLLINVKKGDGKRPDEYYVEGEKQVQDPEILYSVKDVSNIEQGRGGFVHSVKAKHEDIAAKEAHRVRRDSGRTQDLTEQLSYFMLNEGDGNDSRRGSYQTSSRTSRSSSVDKTKFSPRGSFSGTPTKERLSRQESVSSTGDECSAKISEFIRAESEIIYSLTDVSDIEQGGSGFVKSLLQRHESICQENSEEPPPTTKKLVRSRTEPFPV